MQQTKALSLDHSFVEDLILDLSLLSLIIFLWLR